MSFPCTNRARLSLAPVSLSRRDVLILAGAAALLPNTTLSQGGAGQYLLSTLSDKAFPLSKVGTCADLEKAVAFFDNEAKRAAAQPEVAGAEYLKRASAERNALKGAIKQAEQNQDLANIDKLFAGINLGVRATLVGLGCVLTGPYAVGALLGATVLSGPSLFTAQAMFKQGVFEPESVWGYAVGRGFTLHSIAKGGAAPLEGFNMVKAASLGVALFVAAYQLGKAEGKNKDALVALKLATTRLKEVDAGMNQMGTDLKKWGGLYSQVMAASRDGLRKYIDDMKSTNCMFVPPAGPQLKRG